MKNREFMLLIVGIIFICIGLIISSKHKWKKAKTYVPIFIGLTLCYLTLFGPLSTSKSELNKIIAIDSVNVEYISIEPTYESAKNSKPNQKMKLVFKKRNEINQFCAKLHLATIEGENYVKNPTKKYKVKILLKSNEVLYFMVEKENKATCIKAYSNAKFGWHYGNLKAPALGELID